jgi:capsular polysaccharide biosynthesis protein
VTDPSLPNGVSVWARESLPEQLWDYDDFTGTGEGPRSEPLTSFVSLGFVGAALRRSAWIWCATAALGLVIGVGLLQKVHPAYQVTVSIFMTNDPSEDPGSAMLVDALLAQDPRVAEAVIQKLGLNESPASLLKNYTATANNNAVLSITVISPSANAAASEANALAEEFLQYRTGILLAQQTSVSAAQSQKIAQDQKALSSLEKQISHVEGESATPAQQNELHSLRVKQASDSNVLATLQQSVASSQAISQLSTVSMISNSKIINTGYPAITHSRKKYAIEYVGGLFFGGLMLGMVIVIVRALASDRLRRRDDVADALGAPVRLSVSTSSRGSLQPIIRRRACKRNRDMKRVVSCLRSAVPSNRQAPVSLAVVAVDNPKTAASTIIELAVELVRDGKQVVVADLAGGAIARLVHAKGPGARTVNVRGVSLVLVVPDPDDVAPLGPLHPQVKDEMANTAIAVGYSGTDVLITLATLDPAVGADYLKTWADDVIAVVTAGQSSVVKVRAAGEMIRYAGTHLLGGILLGADKSDDSLGMASA